MVQLARQAQENINPIDFKVLLFQGPRALGGINASPFCVKVEFFLRYAKIPYEVQGFSPKLAPRGKMPFIQLDSNFVSDSENIIDHLSERCGIDLDSHLNAEQKQLSHLVRRTLEDGSYFAMLWNRWGDDENWKAVKKSYFSGLPPIIRNVVPEILRRQVLRSSKGQGIALYTEPEVLRDLNRDLSAVTYFMSDSGPFYFGGQLSRLDLTVFGYLNCLLKAQLPSPLQVSGNFMSKLHHYVDGICSKYFSDF